jgi:hypothetical protein
MADDDRRGEHMLATTKARLADLQKLLGKAGVSDSNPCGAVAYYDEGSTRPCRIADNWISKTIFTYVEARREARDWEKD